MVGHTRVATGEGALELVVRAGPRAIVCAIGGCGAAFWCSATALFSAASFLSALVY